MKRMSQYRHTPPVLSQPSIWKREYHLTSEGTVLMTLTYPKLFGSKAIVEGFGGSWEISKPSIWRQHLDIKRGTDHLPYAKYLAGSWGKGGMFHLPNGGRIEYRAGGWKQPHRILSDRNSELAVLKRESFWKSSLLLSITNESELLDNHPWIIMAVMYHIVAQRQRQAAAA